jgi:hypothetical protein
METLIQITGVRYACKENDISAVMAKLEQQKPEVLLVTEQTSDFGIIVQALIGTTYRGVVSRFDLEHVLSMMQHDRTSVLVGRVTETDSEGLCYTISITGEYPTQDISTNNTPDLWTNWNWMGAPLLDSTADDRRLCISIKVALTELRHSGRINKQTLLEHLAMVLELARWDVSRETQTQLGELQRLVGQHTDKDVRALAPQFRHTLSAFGSKKRIKAFQDIYLPELTNSTEAEQMLQNWREMHKAELSNIKQWQPAISKQLDAIETSLMQLPADLCYQKDLFGALMHRLLYLDIPRKKLLMLLSALVLRQQLRNWLEQLDKDLTNDARKTELKLILKLTPLFYDNIDSASEFVALAKELNTTEITSLVSRWVRDKRICANHCHRPLWTILHDAGIYKATESNWNAMLDIRKKWG